PSAAAAAKGASPPKAKRVRTGCLTCRERHLKCDEGVPVCANCLKSNRDCKRGVKLNFIDIWTEAPAVNALVEGTPLEFHDESRAVASEYKGGTERYRHFAPSTTEPSRQPQSSHVSLAGDLVTRPFRHSSDGVSLQQMHGGNPWLPHHPRNNFNPHHVTPPTLPLAHRTPSPPPAGEPPVLTSANEMLYMQIFTEEVALWMDALDPSGKYFTLFIPRMALRVPMMREAILACGAEHLGLVNPAHYPESNSLEHYHVATRLLLEHLGRGAETNQTRGNPREEKQKQKEAAITAVLLNVYELMRANGARHPGHQRTNHVAGARALINSLGWNYKTPDVGGACFWLNIGFEILSCLHFGWRMEWKTDSWGLDMDSSADTRPHRETIWARRMLYVLAKLCDYRADFAEFADAVSKERKPLNPRSECFQMSLRLAEAWTKLWDMNELWFKNRPDYIRQTAIVRPQRARSKFPEVWYIGSVAVVSTLFHYTAKLLLTQSHPSVMANEGSTLAEHEQITRSLKEDERYSAGMICAITAHVKDRGVASIAIQALHHAARTLTDLEEQTEVFAVFERIARNTGWRIEWIYAELRQRWGWTTPSQRTSPLALRFAPSAPAAAATAASATAALPSRTLLPPPMATSSSSPSSSLPPSLFRST
ncbi:uncharacterized protein K489DRAFT_321356, partial [Dissoconium aciculare CBS 342.82]|uniref:Zn(2)-C6 fungal-type domain-containing protein n=1 Tax=Dissoconium aciculare CBS 342.82 TaxID=1314786 RepID=A0A6J3M193_9PEZI